MNILHLRKFNKNCENLKEALIKLDKQAYEIRSISERCYVLEGKVRNLEEVKDGHSTRNGTTQQSKI